VRTNPVCWFEVGDFLDYMRNHRTPSGIQRVEREILTRIEIDHVPSGRAAACRLDRLSHEFEPVDLSFLTDPVVDWMQRCTEPERRSLANIARWLLGPPTMRDEAPRHQIPFTDGDVLVSLGGACHDRHYPEVVGRLRRECGVRVAFQLYDIIPVTHPAWVVPTLAEGFRSWIREMVAIADLVFTSSHHVRRELLSYVSAEGLRQPPVAVLRFASGFEKWNPAAQVKQTPEVSWPRQFALFVSTIEFRKNHQLLIRVWRRLIEKHGWAAVPHLVFVGRVAFGVQDLMRELDESRNLDGKIIVAPELTDAELEQA